jgi:hypothetical protein
MAGTLVANTINTDTGLFSTNNAYSGIAKAYLNYNASTQTVRASFNISSVTYNGTGDITLNFATAMPDANYTIVGSVQAIAGTANPWIMINGYLGPTLQAPTTSACRVFCQQTGAGYNSAYICISIFGA